MVEYARYVRLHADLIGKSRIFGFAIEAGFSKVGER